MKIYLDDSNMFMDVAFSHVLWPPSSLSDSPPEVIVTIPGETHWYHWYKHLRKFKYTTQQNTKQDLVVHSHFNAETLHVTYAERKSNFTLNVSGFHILWVTENTFKLSLKVNLRTSWPVVTMGATAKMIFPLHYPWWVFPFLRIKGHSKSSICCPVGTPNCTQDPIFLRWFSVFLKNFGDNPPSLFHLLSLEQQIHWQPNNPTA